jgi:hypothetical protein
MKMPYVVATRGETKPPGFKCRPFAGPPGLAPMIRTHSSNTNAFTAEEHLRVQQAIERRAHELWRERDGPPDHALNHWLQAEHEVVAGFVRNRLQFDTSSPDSSKMDGRNRQRRNCCP